MWRKHFGRNLLKIYNILTTEVASAISLMHFWRSPHCYLSLLLFLQYIYYANERWFWWWYCQLNQSHYILLLLVIWFILNRQWWKKMNKLKSSKRNWKRYLLQLQVHNNQGCGLTKIIRSPYFPNHEILGAQLVLFI